MARKNQMLSVNNKSQGRSLWSITIQPAARPKKVWISASGEYCTVMTLSSIIINYPHHFRIRIRRHRAELSSYHLDFEGNRIRTFQIMMLSGVSWYLPVDEWSRN